MSKPAEFNLHDYQDEAARNIAHLWNKFYVQKREMTEQWKELRNYIFATDTSTTTNKSLPWKNSTTIPKLCQIRDNLHSNYLSALFPNDDWLKWESYSKDDASKQKAKTITAYMSNKCRTGHFRKELSKLLYDYIDYGNCFVTTRFDNDVVEDDRGNEKINFIGPKAVRISPMDIVFNPVAGSFEESFKIIRSIRNISELKVMADTQPDNAYLKEALNKREAFKKVAYSYGVEDADKAEGFQIDGFGNLQEYYQSGYVEVLEFWGDYHDEKTGEVHRNKVITVIDRMWVIRNEDIPNWLGSAPIYHVGWRTRPDNLWAMGPLDNLVGMQYRIDHLENLKADAMDLCVHPPLVISGDVEEFNYAPGEEIHLDEGGAVTELARNTQWVLTANNDISLLEMKMEQMAGAPSEAMGIRSPGEKTAFEVSQLQNAAGRIFQEKITMFETQLEEGLLNAMLETAVRNMDRTDVVRILDEDLGVEDFMSITVDDITGNGKLRPVGARHFAAQAQMVQNITQLSGTPLFQMVQPHMSTIQLAKMMEDLLGIERYDLFKPNQGITENADTQRVQNQAQEDLIAEQGAPVI